MQELIDMFEAECSDLDKRADFATKLREEIEWQRDEAFYEGHDDGREIGFDSGYEAGLEECG